VPNEAWCGFPVPSSPVDLVGCTTDGCLRQEAARQGHSDLQPVGFLLRSYLRLLRRLGLLYDLLLSGSKSEGCQSCSYNCWA